MNAFHPSTQPTHWSRAPTAPSRAVKTMADVNADRRRFLLNAALVAGGVIWLITPAWGQSGRPFEAPGDKADVERERRQSPPPSPEEQKNNQSPTGTAPGDSHRNSGGAAGNTGAGATGDGNNSGPRPSPTRPGAPTMLGPPTQLR